MATRMVVFDLVGTTLRDDAGAVPRALRDALDAVGLSVRDAALEGVNGLARLNAIATLLEGHGRDDLLSNIPAIHADVIARLQRHFCVPGSAIATDGCVGTFAALRRAGVLVAVGCGLPRAVVQPICAQLGWAVGGGPIDAIMASDEVARPRPYPDMIDALRYQLGDIAAIDVAKVGDTPLDMQEGTMARCGLVVAVASNAGSRDRLMQHPHDAIINGLGELPQLLVDRGLMAVPA